jgi:hypothetical protein
MDPAGFLIELKRPATAGKLQAGYLFSRRKADAFS